MCFHVFICNFTSFSKTNYSCNIFSSSSFIFFLMSSMRRLIICFVLLCNTAVIPVGLHIKTHDTVYNK